MYKIQCIPRVSFLINTKVEIKGELEELLRLEVLWKQRFKVEWLMCMDRNTTFFHRKTSQRKQVNIIKIPDDDGNVYKNVEDIGEVLTKYFSNLFTSSLPHGMAEIASLVEGRNYGEM